MTADYASDDRPIMRCDHDGSTAFVATANAHTLGWDWFTGWLPATRHFCKKHADSPQRNADFAKSKVKEPTNG